MSRPWPRITAGCIGALLAVFNTADGLASGGSPSLEFRTLRVEEAGKSEHRVAPYRMFNKMTVTVWDTLSCDQTPVDPSVSIRDGRLYLRYAVAPAAAGTRRCTAVSEFNVSNLPRRDLEVHFIAGGAETVAKLKPCPFSSPTSGNRYDCLMPADQ